MMEHESDCDRIYKWCAWHVSQNLGKETERNGNRWANRDHPKSTIVVVRQNTEKSHGDLRRLLVTQTQVKGHQLTQVWKNHKK